MIMRMMVAATLLALAGCSGYESGLRLERGSALTRQLGRQDLGGNDGHFQIGPSR